MVFTIYKVFIGCRPNKFNFAIKKESYTQIGRIYRIFNRIYVSKIKAHNELKINANCTFYSFQNPS